MKIKSINFYIFRSILKIFIIGSVIYPFLLFSVSTGSVSINQLEFSPESAGVGAYSGKTGVISFDNPGSVSFTRSRSVSLIHGFHMNSFLGEGFTLLLPTQGAFSFGVELKSLAEGIEVYGDQLSDYEIDLLTKKAEAYKDDGRAVEKTLEILEAERVDIISQAKEAGWEQPELETISEQK